MATPNNVRPLSDLPPPRRPSAPAPEMAPERPRRSTRGERTRERRERVERHTHRTRKRAINITINKGGQQSTVGQATAASGATAAVEPSPPGAGFTSNEDIRAFAEALRKAARSRAVERSMDTEHLYEVLRHIPTADGSKAGARPRARRVTRHLRIIAAAESIIARNAAALWRSFEAEFESELSRVGKARPKKGERPRGPFKFE